jgi:hypothetical protein
MVVLLHVVEERLECIFIVMLCVEKWSERQKAHCAILDFKNVKKKTPTIGIHP